MRFVKGHGTENDFLVVPDPDGELDLRSDLVAALCDRRAGLGADGVLRVVRTAAVPEQLPPRVGEGAEWFMDYRNADGSVSEMCGNGIRVFARYLAVAGLIKAEQPLPIATRGGLKEVRFAEGRPDGTITVDMGAAALPPEIAQVRVVVDGHGSWDAVGVLLPNPHAVAFVPDLAAVGDLSAPPRVLPEEAYPEGVNVEFVVDRGPRHVAMRVHERGVGETRSCGTGAGAAAVAAMRRDGRHARSKGDGAPAAYVVDVPGGRLEVTERVDGHVELTGPAVLVAEGSVDARWLAAFGVR